MRRSACRAGPSSLGEHLRQLAASHEICLIKLSLALSSVTETCFLISAVSSSRRPLHKSDLPLDVRPPVLASFRPRDYHLEWLVPRTAPVTVAAAIIDAHSCIRWHAVSSTIALSFTGVSRTFCFLESLLGRFGSIAETEHCGTELLSSIVFRD